MISYHVCTGRLTKYWTRDPQIVAVEICLADPLSPHFVADFVHL